MAKRADVMAKGLTLTSEQAAKFWPLFDQFQKEQDKVVQEQIAATEAYAKSFDHLTDENAMTYVNALLDRDLKMHDLRVKWLAKFKTVVPIAMAARAIQLDRRLGNITQVQISQQIPLVH
jgi:Spy/CpxP family protein refolding chaperone